MTTKEVFTLILLFAIMGLDLFCKVPQIAKLIKCKKSDGISVSYYLIWNLSSTLYIVYCLIIEERLLIIGTSMNILLNLWIVILALKYKRKSDYNAKRKTKN